MSIFGKGSSPPAAPNPGLAVAAQSAANKDAIRESARVSSIDQFTPFGSLTFTRDDEGLPTSQIQSLTVPQQNLVDKQLSLGNTLGAAAQNQAAFLPQDQFNLDGVSSAQPSALDFSGLAGISPQSGQAVEQATFDRGLSLLQPEFQQQQERLNQQLANQGLPTGSEAFGAEQSRFQRGRDETLSRLANDAVLAGRQEQSRLFGQDLTQRQQGISEQLQNIGLADQARSRDINERLLQRTQPFNELSAFLQGSPSLPFQGFAPPPQFNVAPPDVIGAQFGAANLANQNFATQQGINASNLGGLFGLGGALGAAGILAR
jgi:hypothetical protein